MDKLKRLHVATPAGQRMVKVIRLPEKLPVDNRPPDDKRDALEGMVAMLTLGCDHQWEYVAERDVWSCACGAFKYD